jgi:hypothetical protein
LRTGTVAAGWPGVADRVRRRPLERAHRVFVLLRLGEPEAELGWYQHPTEDRRAELERYDDLRLEYNHCRPTNP